MKRCVVAKAKIAPAFDTAKRHLEEHRFAGDQIDTKVITGVVSRAGAIAEEVETGGYGTIVVGRRGLSKGNVFLWEESATRLSKWAGAKPCGLRANKVTRGSLSVCIIWESCLE